jgi:hypothetical protein
MSGDTEEQAAAAGVVARASRAVFHRPRIMLHRHPDRRSVPTYTAAPRGRRGARPRHVNARLGAEPSPAKRPSKEH